MSKINLINIRVILLSPGITLKNEFSSAKKWILYRFFGCFPDLETRNEIIFDTAGGKCYDAPMPV